MCLAQVRIFDGISMYFHLFYEHGSKMKMALDSNLLQSINITAFFTYILII